MWIPRTAEQLEAAVAAGELEETSTFDAKRELPAKKKNSTVAIDIAAMSTAGGVIIYGVAEDDHDRPTVLSPIALQGQADRIAQIVESCISPVPAVEFVALPLPGAEEIGYLVVVVPRSPMAPHQVVVGEDLRFYGRGAKGNRILSEPEVAALYSQRAARDVDRARLLDECIEGAPAAPCPGVGYLHAFARPTVPGEEIWEAAANTVGGEVALQSELATTGRRHPIMGRFDPAVGGVGWHWRRLGADAWGASTAGDFDGRSDDPTRLAQAIFHLDGRGTLFCGRAAERLGDDGSRPYIFEELIAGNTQAFLSMMGQIYDVAGYQGTVDIGVAVTGIEGAGSFVNNRTRFGDTIYRAESFTRTARVTASELRDGPRITMMLLARFFSAATGTDGYDPFVARPPR